MNVLSLCYLPENESQLILRIKLAEIKSSPQQYLLEIVSTFRLQTCLTQIY